MIAEANKNASHRTVLVEGVGSSVTTEKVLCFLSCLVLSCLVLSSDDGDGAVLVTDEPRLQRVRSDRLVHHAAQG